MPNPHTNFSSAPFTVESYRQELSRILGLLDSAAITRAIAMIESVWIAGGQVFTCGNGGSALTASHYITDWGKMAYLIGGRPFRGYCLNDNIGMVTAYGNDLSYAETFCKAVENYARPGDLLIVISGSGNSRNVVKALESAHRIGVSTLAVCGYDGGAVRKLAQHSIWCPSFDMQICEDVHLTFGHMVMKALCRSPLALAK